MTQVKSLGSDGYVAIQVTTGAKKANRLTAAEAGHFAKAGVDAGRGLWEFRLNESEAADVAVGAELNVGVFADVKKVDVTGTSKGKGFAQVLLSAGTSVPRTLLTVTLVHTVCRVQLVRTNLRGKCSRARRWLADLGNERVTVQCLDVVTCRR